MDASASEIDSADISCDESFETECSIAGGTIVVKNNETNDKFYRKVAFPRYTESVKFMSQSRETALKLKPHRGLGTRLPSPS